VSPVHPGSGQAARTATAERTHCVPLLEAASIDLYKRNGFRITGLASDATAKQVSKRGDKLKLMEELGQGVGANTNAFALNPPPSVDDIREALQRLKDPESRLIDEFFWFWPEESSESDEAIQAYLTGDGEKAFDFWHGRRGTSAPGMVAYHNLAVINHMMAIEWTTQYLDASPDAATQERISAYWSTAIRYWRRVGQNDSAWDALKERIRILDDPRLTTGLARRMRAVLPEAVASINATFALKLAERGQASATETQIKYVRDIGLDDHLREEMFLRLLKPTCERFSTQVNEVGKTEQEPKKRFASAQAVLAQVPVVSHLLETFFGLSSHHRTELLDEAIVACANAATAYQKVTGDMEGFLAAAKQSLPYATSTETRERSCRDWQPSSAIPARTHRKLMTFKTKWRLLSGTSELTPTMSTRTSPRPWRPPDWPQSLPAIRRYKRDLSRTRSNSTKTQRVRSRGVSTFSSAGASSSIPAITSRSIGNTSGTTKFRYRSRRSTVFVMASTASFGMEP
jgi:hypothetical protein